MASWLARLRECLGCQSEAMSPLDFEDEATLYSLSLEYFEAATVLRETPPVRLGYSMVTYYLAGHAAELTLKSFLYKHGETIDVLAKSYGHDLKKLVKYARRKGLTDSISTKHIQDFAKSYARKHTEYRQKQPIALPPIDALLSEIANLQSQVFNDISDHLDGE